jgi:hypothetical protein
MTPPHTTHAQTAQTATTIRAQLAPLWIPGGILELRMIGTAQGTVAGWFNDPQALALAAAPFDGRAQIYTTLNRVNPDLPTRLRYTLNQIVIKPKTLTTDAEIFRRDWMLVDIDPIRAPDTSSTDAEHEQALDCAEAIRRWLMGQGMPEAALVTADSGNGGHVRARLDLPNDPASATLIARILQVIADRFTTDTLAIDRTVWNASRLVKLYGTHAVKGPAHD